MHRASGIRPRKFFLYLTPLAGLMVLGLVFGRPLLGASDEVLASASLPAPTPEQTTAVTASPTSTSAPEIDDLGTKRGTITLTGPAKAGKGSYVVWVLDGPERVLKTDATSPFRVKVDTEELPNGKYTVTTLWVRSGKSSIASTERLQIKNVTPTPTSPAETEEANRGDSDAEGSDGGASNGGAQGGGGAAGGGAAGGGSAGGGSAGGGSAGGGSAGGGSAGGGSPAPVVDSTIAGQVLALTNEERAKAGCEPLTADNALNAAAQAHSEDMASNGYFSHDSQDGRSPFDRIRAAGYSYSAAAENIAMGQRSAADVLDGWMNSAGHRANILNCTYTELGVGYALGDGSPYWTQKFGAPL